MKTYWDTSALILALHNPVLRNKASEPGHGTCGHALSEMFSTLTGGRMGFRYLPGEASEMIDHLTRDFEFVILNEREIKDALAQAEAKGVRGGRVHDWLHAVAAKKGRASELLTRIDATFWVSKMVLNWRLFSMPQTQRAAQAAP